MTTKKPQMDAWEQMYRIHEKYTKEWQIRPDLKVTAMGTSRAVCLQVGKTSPKFQRPGRPEQFAITTRNVGTMRELANALLAACDFVDEANPKWAQRA